MPCVVAAVGPFAVPEAAAPFAVPEAASRFVDQEATSRYVEAASRCVAPALALGSWPAQRSAPQRAPTIPRQLFAAMPPIHPVKLSALALTEI
jgi:hypothetical protein